ncbi:MAG: alanine--tRNA ligase [Bacteroidales bacterium]|jgi:alanyl-tRNA synthetase|nr:alanine--tRNA ligase [Bacteroidales bacterium]MDD4213465.1 alanine--tRNA ligase [Bacteroidales bacterium]
MKSKEVRNTFLEFFRSKQHQIVPSAPMVIKNDPTLMFTNAGMNQFKDIFLGNEPAIYKRVADTQKCLRVSGKHNDLEEVGHDTYHHTMFEMIGNWSFGDYFKKEAIDWAWELLTDVYKINAGDLYVTIFAGDEKEGLPKDDEAYNFWKNRVPEEKILLGSKKDNFWEMGESGPCGPCSEIHIDLRSEEEKHKIAGKDLVNKGNPLVIEIWNLVFIQFNRKSDGKLEPLKAKHVDTGMGFERLSMVLQKVKSNYDTDIFQPLIQQIALLANCRYGENSKKDIAIRVIADHLRAVAFAIADGQLPSNNKAGYVIRRILRRAVRYGYTFLGFKEPFMNSLVSILASQMGETFQELLTQKELITKVIAEEESAFLRTLDMGIHKFENYKAVNNSIDGRFAFELFDTYGFPVDLTQLMAKEKGYVVDMEGYNTCLNEQKIRSRQAATVDKEDWVVVHEYDRESVFVGYDTLSANSKILRYRKIKSKGKTQYQFVLDKTPFYAESGGQMGDKGILQSEKETIKIEDTIKENNLIIHLVSELPEHIHVNFEANVDRKKRLSTQNNHTATHLLHKALKEVLGNHVEQKGSLVNDEYLRFDFSHFTGLTNDEKKAVERIVFQKIAENLNVEAATDVPLDIAKTQGAVALFGEKYGDKVRVISIGESYSKELCGGTHVKNTGQIGLFLITEETAIAAGVRRIEALTGETAYAYIQENFIEPLEKIKLSLKKKYTELPETVHAIIEQNNFLRKQIEALQKDKAQGLKEELKTKVEQINGVNFLTSKTGLDPVNIKDIAFALKNDMENLFLVLASENNGKASITLMISENLVETNKWNASRIIRDLAKEIQGGGGGQDFYATAGGKNPEGIEKVFLKAKEFVSGNTDKQ